MASVLVDSAAWIALIDVADDLHVRAVEVLESLRQGRDRLVTTEFVLLEVADALSAPRLRRLTIGYVDRIYELPDAAVHPCSHRWFVEGWDLYRRRPDKDWSLTDCISFAVMTERGSPRRSPPTTTLSRRGLRHCCEGHLAGLTGRAAGVAPLPRCPAAPLRATAPQVV